MNLSNGVKRADNGSIGEARTKSFLIDRFWILERSIDIEGADFLIQRKIQNESILDEKSVRFGIIQSKFSQNENTYHKIKRDYVIDKNGNPHMEFFLIVNVGHEDSQIMCLISAQDIIKDFQLDNNYQYSISTKKLIEYYQVNNKRKSLDYIEYSIQYVNFYKNRMYIFKEINSFTLDTNIIHPDFTLNIEFNDGNIPDLFQEQKKKAYDYVIEIEKIHKHLINFIDEVNPIESCYIAESFNHEYKDLLVPQIFDIDFYYKTKSYYEQIELLRKDSLLNNFLSIREVIKNKVDNFLQANKDKIYSDSIHLICVKYDKDKLDKIFIENEIVTGYELNNKYYNYIELKEGIIRVLISIKHYEESLSINEVVLNNLLEKIYELKYFETDYEC